MNKDMQINNEWGFTTTIFAPKISYYDTEQNPINTAKVIRRVHQMLGWPTDRSDDRLQGHCLRTIASPAAKMEYIINDIENRKPDVAFIDGVADLCDNFNDIESSNKVIAQLMKLSHDYNCAVVCVLHENKQKDDHGMKGHLGTMLLQKASEVYQVKKQGNIFNVETTDSRNLPLPAFSFRVNAEGVPVPAETLQEDKQLQKLLELRGIFNKCFESKSEFTWTELRDDCALFAGVSLVTAGRYLKDALRLQILSIKHNKYVFVE